MRIGSLEFVIADGLKSRGQSKFINMENNQGDGKCLN
jgi:hypothetical protein